MYGINGGKIIMTKIIKCPKCNKRIFDAEEKSIAYIEIKCTHCHRLVHIELKPNNYINK